MANQSSEPRHYLSGDGVLKEAWNPQAHALEVALKNTEVAIALSASEGDSVIAVVPSATLSEGTHSCAGIKTVCRYGDATISVSPDVSGEEWHVLSCEDLTPKEICAMRIKITGAGKVVVRG